MTYCLSHSQLGNRKSCVLIDAKRSIWHKPDAREWADKTLTFLDAELSDGKGGYFENDQKTQPRRANPHLHFLEAVLAW